MGLTASASSNAQLLMSDLTFHLATVAIGALCVWLFWIIGYGPGRAPRYVRRRTPWLVLNTLLVTTAAHLLMLAPPPPAGTPCVASQRVWGPLEMVVSCDSIEFVRVAEHPRALSTSFRQTRPLQPMSAALLSRAQVGYGPHLPPAWFSFVVLNFAALVTALMVFRELVAPKGTAAAVAVAILGVFLTFNNVVKGFFWSAHTQMWNVLMPLVSIAISVAFLRQPDRDWRFMLATGALLGIAWLAYPSMVICAVAAIAASMLGFRINGAHPRWRHVLGKWSLFLALVAAPMVIWISVLITMTGNLNFPEVQGFRQFVWVLDSWRTGGIGAVQQQARLFLGEFATHLWPGLWPALVLLAMALLAGRVSPRRLRAAITARSLTLTAAIITLVLCLGFFALMGFYRQRLEFNVVVSVFVMASVILIGVIERMASRLAAVTLLVVMAGAMAYITAAVVRVGPYV